jgi:hypothetical protein
MNNRISDSSTTELFALAAKLQQQKSHGYAPEELVQAATEAGISRDNLEEALQLMHLGQTQDQSRRRNLRMMISSGVAGSAIALASIWGYSILSQQPAIGRGAFPVANAYPVNPDRPGAPPLNDDATTYKGRVEQYLLNPEGRVDGLLLNNNLQVKVPPHLSDQLTNMIAPNAQISIIGVAGTPTRFGQEIRATQITNLGNQQTIINQPPGVPPQPLANRASYSSLSSDGVVRRWLVGHRGELNGAILASGVQVKFPPHVGEQLVGIVQGNDKVQVQGFGSRNNFGEVIQATTLTVNGQSVAIAPPEPNKP